MNSWTTLQSQLTQQKAIDTFWSNSMVTWNHIERINTSEVTSVRTKKLHPWMKRNHEWSLTCLISQLTFHCFMLANLHVVMGIPEDMSIRMRRL